MTTREQELEKALTEMLDWFYPRPDEGIVGFTDRWLMQFYRETRIWPPGKDAPAGMHHELPGEERSRQFRMWSDARRAALEARARAVLSAPFLASGEREDELPEEVMKTMIEVVKTSVVLGGSTLHRAEVRQAAAVDAHESAILSALRAARRGA